MAPIRSIAEQLRQPTEKIQHVAFRPILVGLAEEDPAIALPVSTESLHRETQGSAEMATASDGGDRRPVSNDLLQNLLGFLQSKSRSTAS